MKPWYKPFLNHELYKKKINQLIYKNELTMGKSVLDLEDFLKKKLNVKYICLTNSGTSALFASSILSKKIINKKKPKVICTNLTWIATLNPFIFQDFEIRLVDTKKDSDEVDFDKLNKVIQRIKPDLVILVNLNGQCPYNKKFEILKKKLGFMVIEDSAQALFIKDRKGRYSGTRFELGCYSLGITKPYNMIYGGFCATNSRRLFNGLVAIRNNGVPNKHRNNKLELASQVGLNLRPSNAHAELGLINLQSIDFIESQNKKIVRTYQKYLNSKNIKLVNYESQKDCCYVQALVKKRDDFMDFCHKKGILIHPGLRCISDTKIGSFKFTNLQNSKMFSKQTVRLPCGPGYKINEIIKICSILSKY